MSDAVVVRRRGDGATELRVNGVFVMDDVETTSERRLAERALDAGGREILVGGLGLGFTVRTLLADAGVRRVLVAELHEEVVAACELDDDRLKVVIADVRDVVAGQPAASLDAVLLDVDNGPDFLVHPENAELYGGDFIAECTRTLRRGGTLAVWSMADSPALRGTLAAHLSDVRAESVPVRLQSRADSYWVISAVRTRRGAAAPSRRTRSARTSGR